MPIFRELHLFCDERLRDGAGQMALDQALLETATFPVLRVYRWSGPAVSFGYSQSCRVARESFPAYPLVRRWTGGGMVEHAGDWTFALVCPSTDPVAALRPEETYRLVHSAMVEALNLEGQVARLVVANETALGLACFTAPAVHDIFNGAGEKICGGAQRRTRQGFLHQGSLQKGQVSGKFAQRFGNCLSKNALSFKVTEPLEARAGELERNRYSTEAWQKKIP